MSGYPDEFDAIHKALVADAGQNPDYADRPSIAILGYSEGAEHALDAVRLRLNAIKAQALREAAAEVERLMIVGRTPYGQCSTEELHAYYPYAQNETNVWLRHRADVLEAQA